MERTDLEAGKLRRWDLDGTTAHDDLILCFADRLRSGSQLRIEAREESL